MQRIACDICKSEYSVREVETKGWDREQVDHLCDVCGAILRTWERDRHPIFILTERRAAHPALESK
jgi:hypothetical protein